MRLPKSNHTTQEPCSCFMGSTVVSKLQKKKFMDLFVVVSKGVLRIHMEELNEAGDGMEKSRMNPDMCTTSNLCKVPSSFWYVSCASLYFQIICERIYVDHAPSQI
jgi:hypothetical protein